MENRDNDEKLLCDFNNSISKAYSTIYIKFYDELHYYSNKLFAETAIDGDDILQEIFLKLWENKKHSFLSLSHIKNYLYTAIRNKYKDYLGHQLYVQDYEKTIRSNDQELFSGMVEAEMIILMNSISALLPEECAQIFRLYMEGWEVKEIASELKKSPSTVYTQRTRAIEILKEKIDKNLLLFIFSSRLNHQ